MNSCRPSSVAGAKLACWTTSTSSAALTTVIEPIKTIVTVQQRATCVGGRVNIKVGNPSRAGNEVRMKECRSSSQRCPRVPPAISRCDRGEPLLSPLEAAAAMATIEPGCACRHGVPALVPPRGGDEGRRTITSACGALCCTEGNLPRLLVVMDPEPQGERRLRQPSMTSHPPGLEVD